MKTVSFFPKNGILNSGWKFLVFWKTPHNDEIKRHNHFFIETLLFCIFLAVCGCLNVLDGPLNKNYESTEKFFQDELVPNLLYANNGTSYVTFWDEELKIYRTYDQDVNFFLTEPLFEFEIEEEGFSKFFKFAGTSIAPTTQLDDTGMQVQEENGCIACHVK